MAAARLGADVANYVEAERLLIRDKRCYGVAARDVLTGERFDIRARVVLNAAGAWAEGLLRDVSGTIAAKPGTYSRDACFVINRRPTSPCALAIQGQTRDADAVVARGARHLLLAPWRDRTLVGVWHSVVPAHPDAARLTRDELLSYIDEINASQPGFDLRESEVERVDYGLVPFGDAAAQGRAKVSFGKRSRLIDHRVTDGIAGLVTSVSVRYTVARLDAVNALGCVMKQIYRSDLDRFSPAAVAAAVENPERSARSRSTSDPLPGGEFDDFERLLSARPAESSAVDATHSIDALVANYGTHMHRVVAMADADPLLRRCVAGSHVTLAEVAYAARDEMVETMRDVVFRRTELGTAGHPGDSALDDVAEYLQRTRGWSEQRVREERQAVDAQFERYLATKEPLRHIAPAPETEVASEPAFLTTAV